MNTMNMPGFRAEASFYRSSAHYQADAMLGSQARGKRNNTPCPASHRWWLLQLHERQALLPMGFRCC